MSAPFVAEIRIFACNFAPTGWAQCNGQLLPISQNTALFSLVGTFYGGDGKSTFALPNFQGCAALNQGQGPGLTDRVIGETGGEQFLTLLQSEIPFHTHAVTASNQIGTDRTPAGEDLARSSGMNLYGPSGTQVMMDLQATTPAGGSQPHNNMSPFLTLMFCIALQGVFPARG
ncbi:phage tail protein [Bradyrhizobium diazoefficiens]|nr:tail fiber protein [Bradyrhizobium diazoefficiens]MBR0775296.1 phage tail protein [Bradyrhizobium diazoefficiens]